MFGGSILGYGMYVDTLTKSLPTSKKARQIPLLLGESPEVIQFVQEVLARPKSRYKTNLEENLLNPEAEGSISELLDEPEEIDSMNQILMAFRNADFNSFKPEINDSKGKLPTNSQLITTALQSDPLFAEIVRQCEWSEDYISVEMRGENRHKVSWGDDSGGQGLIHIQEEEEEMTIGGKVNPSSLEARMEALTGK